MQRGFLVITFSVLLSVSTGTVLARDPLTIPTDKPDDFSAVQKDIQSIDQYIGQAQCGGYNLGQSVNGTIAQVSGVPGRLGLWYGAPLSGMATRLDANGDKNSDDDYLFPDSAIGFTTACAANQTQITKNVWVATNNPALPGEIIQKDVTYPHPSFSDPSCTWRTSSTDATTGQKTIAQSAPDVPLKPLEEYAPPPSYDKMTDSPNDQLSPQTCLGFCSYLNTWQYLDCFNPQPIVDPLTGATYMTCANNADGTSGWANKYLCSDQKVTDQANACTPMSADSGNSGYCAGQSCRCSQGGTNPGGDVSCKQNPGLKVQEDPVYYSYYRTYRGTFTRTAVNSDGPPDDTTRSRVQVACYGFYNEFDPKFHWTQPQDRRCVIDVDVSTMRDSQIGKGSIGQGTATADVDPLQVPNQRTKSDAQKDIWFMKLGWGFSLLNENSFKSDYNNDLSAVFLDLDNLDNASMRGVWQVARAGEAPRTAYSNQLRAFDDTGLPRIIVTWWQKQETEVATLLHPRVVRILLPPGYSFGVNPHDPLFAEEDPVITTSSGADALNAERTKSVEVQLNATDDTLGAALTAIQQSFLVHLEEEPIPVIIPMGSPTEFRARAQAWCTWYIRTNGKKNCDDAPKNVKDLIQKLNDYADQIENVRILRASLATYAGKVMSIQQKLTQPIGDWMKTNLTAYQNYLQAQKQFGQDVDTQWRSVQQKMLQFQDQTNMPWCMNQRYETPIYSLLDDWMPSRKPGADGIEGKLTADGLPNLTAPRVTDTIIDFSHIAYMTGSLMLPVLKPVQVRLNIPSPPPGDGGAPILPDLPSVQKIQETLSGALAKLPAVKVTGTQPPLDLPTVDPAQLIAMKATIMQIGQTIDAMNDRYNKFWKSIGPLKVECQNDGDCGGGMQCSEHACVPQNGDSAAKRKQNAACKSWDDETCQHVEMDLMERFQRIGSRKLVQLREDYASVGVIRRTPTLCQPMDQVCLLLHGERPAPASIWQIVPPKNMPDLTTDTKRVVRDATLPDPLGGIDADKFPPYDTDINALLPVYDVPRPIDLTPEQ